MAIMHKTSKLPALMMFMLISITACSQTIEKDATSLAYAGSTPCDSLIKTWFGIPTGPVCDFIKWNMVIDRNHNGEGKFHISFSYGASRNNTNGFINGGTKVEFDGRYNTITTDSQKKILHLKGVGSTSEIWLKELDKNIFLFTDARGNFLIGNAGNSYVLNRVYE